jgi:hypothetical protein
MMIKINLNNKSFTSFLIIILKYLFFINISNIIWYIFLRILSFDILLQYFNIQFIYYFYNYYLPNNIFKYNISSYTIFVFKFYNNFFIFYIVLRCIQQIIYYFYVIYFIIFNEHSDNNPHSPKYYKAFK